MKSSKPSKKSFFNKENFLISISITLGICILPLAFCMYCWSVTKFPPQIFGNSEDHFRGHIISPIPESVEILDVYFDDIIIHPDVTYYFRFYVNREDLNRIISYRKMNQKDIDCSFSSYDPEWWVIPSLNDVESYEYNSPGGTTIQLCYHVPSEIAYYLFFTY